MRKEYIITFCIAFLLLVTIVAVSLMMLLPQKTTTVQDTVKEYETIKKSEYTFEETNGLSFDNLIKEYKITDTQLNNVTVSGGNEAQVSVGNSNPFTIKSEEEISASSSGDYATERTTNSNGGVSNPASTGK